MNKYILTIVISGLFVGCDVLNVEDLSRYGPDNVWNDPVLAGTYLTNLYANTFSGWPVNDGSRADECGGIMGYDAASPTTTNLKFWPYDKIRKINVLLQEIDKGTLREDIKNPMKGQALFLRAYLYFKTVVYHGGVPIIKGPQLLTDDLMVSRNSTSECFEFILQDLDEAYKLLPDRFSGSDFGRVDKCVVIAFKGKVLLYKASPQFNPQNPYENSYWGEAFNANKQAKEMLDRLGFGLLDNYTDVFETERHKEAILSVIYTNPSKTNGRLENSVRPLSESKDATGGDQPIWDFAMAFPMKDGRKINESPKYPYNLQTFWENRDPRFDAVMVYNGAIYELSGKKGRRQYTVPNIASSLDAFGYNIQGQHHYRTGLYTKKGIMEELPSAQVVLNDVDWLEIRYADVLFNYAESANETGNTEIGYEVLKAIRKRAGIEPGMDNLYGLSPSMDRQSMRQALLDEKRIEFCFEGMRFWDLRRHRLLHTVIHGMHKYGLLASVKEGMDMKEAMDKAALYTLLPNDFTYEIVELAFQNPNAETQMYAPESYYFFPIAKSEIEKNPNLDQNKDWGGTFNPAL